MTKASTNNLQVEMTFQIIITKVSQKSKHRL